MPKPLELTLIDSEGNKNHFKQERVPMRKMIEALQLQDEFEMGLIQTNVDGVTKKLEFVAGCFDDSRVTAESIIDGLDAREFKSKIQNIISNVMGMDDADPKEQEN